MSSKRLNLNGDTRYEISKYVLPKTSQYQIMSQTEQLIIFISCPQLVKKTYFKVYN